MGGAIVTAPTALASPPQEDACRSVCGCPSVDRPPPSPDRKTPFASSESDSLEAILRRIGEARPDLSSGLWASVSTPAKVSGGVKVRWWGQGQWWGRGQVPIQGRQPPEADRCVMIAVMTVDMCGGVLTGQCDGSSTWADWSRMYGGGPSVVS